MRYDLRNVTLPNVRKRCDTLRAESNMSGFANKAVGRLLACWGNGDYGRLGHGIQCFPETTPRVCSALTDLRMASVACGGAHTVAIAGDVRTHTPHCETACKQLCNLRYASADTGAAFSMGLNENGQLGHSTNVQSVPVNCQAQCSVQYLVRTVQRRGRLG